MNGRLIASRAASLLGGGILLGVLLGRFLAALDADVPALVLFGHDHGAEVRVPVAERLGLRLRKVEAKNAEHGERSDSKDGRSHCCLVEMGGETGQKVLLSELEVLTSLYT